MTGSLPHINRPTEIKQKFEFYRQHGLEEYYIFSPHSPSLELTGFLRQGDDLIEIPVMNGHVSPRLKVRFDFSESGLQIIRPDGRRFMTYVETAKSIDLARQDYRRAKEDYQRARQERQRAEQARQHGETR